MKHNIVLLVFIFAIHILFISIAHAQKSYILRGYTASPITTPPEPPAIKPNSVAKKKVIPTNNPRIEAAKPLPNIVADRDSNPAVGDINAEPKVPKKPETKPKTGQELANNTPKTETKVSPKNTETKPKIATNPNSQNMGDVKVILPKNPATLPNTPKTQTSPISPKDAPVEVAVSADVAAKNAKLLRVSVDTATAYIGTVYLTGGMSRSGVDCSGLVNLAYKNTGTKIPRTSRELSEFGTEIKEMKNIKVGDLLFFDSNDSKRINHVAMVVRVLPDQIYFIHATCSKGVREDKLIEGYWTPKHRKTMRILPN